jgi:tetratricopeptide (TPR) repeat protein
MSFYDSLHEPPDEKDVGAATAALSKARSAAARSAREAAYIEAAAELFRGYPDMARIERDRNYSAALRAITTAYPDDEEAKIFYALSLLALTRRGEDPALLANAADILEPLFARLPEHPGIAHYLIHVYDDKGDREPGIGAARRYAGIAPLMTHAQHMPSHIFAGLGLWDESNASNGSALEADPQYYHSLMYLVYGQLQLGRWTEARRLVDELSGFAASPQGGRGEQRGLHQTNTWLLLETRDWEAAAEAPMYSDRPLDAAETIYVRGLGLAHTGDLRAASDTVRSLETLLGSVDWANESGLASRAYLVKIQALEIQALIALGTGAHAEAIEILEGAAELEDLPAVNRAPPDSGTGIPAREVFGEVLLELGRYDDAREQFRLALERTPNRLHSMLGLARAAAGSGDKEAARQHYRELLDLLADADTGLPIAHEAVAFLGNGLP